MALTDDVGVFTDIQGFADIVVGDKNTYAFVPQVANNIFDIGNRDGSTPAKGSSSRINWGSAGARAISAAPLTAKIHAEAFRQMKIWNSCINSSRRCLPVPS